MIYLISNLAAETLLTRYGCCYFKKDPKPTKKIRSHCVRICHLRVDVFKSLVPAVISLFQSNDMILVVDFHIFHVRVHEYMAVVLCPWLLIVAAMTLKRVCLN